MSRSTSIRWGDRSYAIDTTVIDAVNVTDDLDVLEPLVDLEVLRVEWTNPHETPIRFPADLSHLAGMRTLRVLALPGWVIDDIGPLAHLDRLEELDLSDTAVDDLGPLAGHPTLRQVAFDRCPIRTLAPLRSVPTLRLVSIEDTAVADVEIDEFRDALPDVAVRC